MMMLHGEKNMHVIYVLCVYKLLMRMVHYHVKLLYVVLNLSLLFTYNYNIYIIVRSRELCFMYAVYNIIIISTVIIHVYIQKVLRYNFCHYGMCA